MACDRFRGQRGVGVVAVLALIAIVGIVLIAAMNMLAASRVRSARVGWDTTLGSFDEIMARYPATEPNAAALELERVGAALGINLVTRSRDGYRKLVGPPR